jgi:uroporphyrinogen-III synthase
MWAVPARDPMQERLQQVLGLLALLVQKCLLYQYKSANTDTARAAMRQRLERAFTQFACFTSTKLLALLVQEYKSNAASARALSHSVLLALLVQNYLLY